MKEIQFVILSKKITEILFAMHNIIYTHSMWLFWIELYFYINLSYSIIQNKTETSYNY